MKSKKLIAMLLVVVMVFSVTSVAAFAETGGVEPDPYAKLKEGTGYVALGDSYTRGYGCSDHWEKQNYTMDKYGNFNCRNVDGSYPNLVAKELRLDAPDDIRKTDAKMWNLAKNAVSTAYTLDLLGVDDGFRDSEFTYKDGSLSSRYKTDLAYFGDPLSYNFEGTGTYGKTGEVKSVRKLLNEARLITINLGHADVLYKAQWLDFNHIDFSDTESLPSEIVNLISDLYEYFEYWKGAYPLLLDYIKENNKNNPIVICLGQINPVETMVISDELLLPIGEALNIIMDLMNKYTKQYAEERGFIYLDTSNVETPSTQSQLTVTELLTMPGDLAGLETHPSPEGYAQIARMIVDKVNEKMGIAPVLPKTFIQIDMGAHTNVSYVTLDGNRANGWRMNKESHVLTIPCTSTAAKSVTVAVDNGDGTISFMTYHLQYDNGYTARRTYLTNDFMNTFTTTFKTVFGAILNIFKTIFSAFVK